VQQVRTVLLSLLLAVLTGALVGGIVGELNGLPTTRITPIEEVSWSWHRFLQGTARCAAVGLLGWMVLKLVGWATTPIFGGAPDLSVTIIRFYGSYGAVGAVISTATLIRAARTAGHATSDLRRRDVLAAAARGLLVGLTVGTTVALMESPLELLGSRILPPSIASNLPGLAASVIGGLLVGLVAGLAGGWSGRELQSDRLLKPGQGVWQAARNGISVGLCSGLVAGLWAGAIYAAVAGFEYGPLVELAGGAAVGIGVGVVVGTVLGLVNGGSTLIKHFVLRWLLWSRGLLPWRYVRFLDHTVERGLLRRAGGGYMFIHAMLRDYFAELASTESSRAPAAALD
jgi:hypothetical protein